MGIVEDSQMVERNAYCSINVKQGNTYAQTIPQRSSCNLRPQPMNHRPPKTQFSKACIKPTCDAFWDLDPNIIQAHVTDNLTPRPGFDLHSWCQVAPSPLLATLARCLQWIPLGRSLLLSGDFLRCSNYGCGFRKAYLPLLTIAEICL